MLISCRAAIHAFAASLLVTTAAAAAACDGQCSALLQVQTSHSVLAKTARPTRRVAVVLVLHSLDACRVSRARKLAATLGPKYDAWVLHGSKRQDPALLAKLRGMKIKLASQGTVPKHGGWRTFGSPLSGFSKAAFLKFVVAHPEYDFVWQVEDDVVFTGKWGQLFDHLQHAFPTQSLVSKTVFQSYNTSKWYLGSCKLAPGVSCATSEKEFLSLPGYDTKYDRNLHGRVHVHVDWLLTRVSHEFAVKLAAQLETKAGAGGHHEGIAGPYCLSQGKDKHAGWCELGVLPQKLMGIFETGHWGNFAGQIAKKSKAGGLVPWRLYHPLKCKRHEKTATRGLASDALEY